MHALVMYFNVDHLFFYLFIPLICILLYNRHIFTYKCKKNVKRGSNIYIYIYIFYPYGPLSEIKDYYYVFSL